MGIADQIKTRYLQYIYEAFSIRRIMINITGILLFTTTSTYVACSNTIQNVYVFPQVFLLGTTQNKLQLMLMFFANLLWAAPFHRSDRNKISTSLSRSQHHIIKSIKSQPANHCSEAYLKQINRNHEAIGTHHHLCTACFCTCFRLPCE